MMGGLSIHLFYGYHTYTRTCSVSFLFFFFCLFLFFGFVVFWFRNRGSWSVFSSFNFPMKMIEENTVDTGRDLKSESKLKSVERFRGWISISSTIWNQGTIRIFVSCIFLFWPRYCWASKVKWAERRRIIFRSPEKKPALPHRCLITNVNNYHLSHVWSTTTKLVTFFARKFINLTLLPPGITTPFTKKFISLIHF